MVLPLGNRVIYGLIDPRDGTARYVGVTDSPHRRLSEHLRAKDKRQPKLTAWITELRTAKLAPIFIFLDSISAENALKAELEWIQHFDRIAPLFNHVKK
jgi:predicted GIY-YIG superfamily endonuclease